MTVKKQTLTTEEIRSMFLNFFKSKGHEVVPSSNLIPYEDPTLLFTNAGRRNYMIEFAKETIKSKE